MRGCHFFVNAQQPGVKQVSVPNPVGGAETLPERFVLWVQLHIDGRAEILLDLRVAGDVVILENVRTPEKYAFRCQVNRVSRFVGPLSANLVS